VGVAAYTPGIDDDVSWDPGNTARGHTGVPVRPHD
jgi:hypothetical protein